MSAEVDMYYMDEWPLTADGEPYDGKDLLKLLREDKSPFRNDWDARLLIEEVEKVLNAEIHDIFNVSRGSNNYGFHIDLSDGRQVVARLAKGDVNMPDYDGYDFDTIVAEVEFEAEIYQLIREEPRIKTSTLLHHRSPVLLPKTGPGKPTSILGRTLLLYVRAIGENNVWKTLSHDGKMILLSQAAHIRAALFHFPISQEFAQARLLKQLLKPKPKAFPSPVAPTRQFCLDLLMSKVVAMIGELGTMIGWEDDNEVVGPIAFASRSSLLRLIPHILPEDNTFYRLGIEHGDFGIHNMSIEVSAGTPQITSLYDWETAYIVPIILSDTQMAVVVDLDVDPEAVPIVTRLKENETEEDLKEYQSWTDHYHKILFDEAPEYQRAIKAGKDARHIWFALKGWKGGNSEEFFGALGAWAEKRLQELQI